MKEVTIVNYGSGNTASVAFAFERLGCKVLISDAHDILLGADRVVLPGVGHAAFAMKNLQDKGLDEVLRRLESPFLGICLGMQLMGIASEEGNNTKGLGLLPFEVKALLSTDKVPHIGWNKVECNKANGPTNGYAYFVHSFYVPLQEYTIATVEHGIQFSAAVQKGNKLGCQFHPEKSQSLGKEWLNYFLSLS